MVLEIKGTTSNIPQNGKHLSFFQDSYMYFLDKMVMYVCNLFLNSKYVCVYKDLLDFDCSVLYKVEMLVPYV